jgi:pimeloyl-ACP methyl ester carboxylesterase
MRDGVIEANGLKFAYLEEGEGPLVLLLHGYPDNAYTWTDQLTALAGAGFRAVAPLTRGYPPTQIPGEGAYFDAATLATDARELILALNDGAPSFVVGHDWGAATTYSLIAGYPEAVTRAVTLAIPHPLLIARALSDPRAVRRAFHWFYFQLPEIPEQAIRANDFAFIEYLWASWSPDFSDKAHVERIKEMFKVPGAVEASLAYYRSMFNPAKQDPALQHVREALRNKITVPTMNVIGSKDLSRTEGGEAQAALFDADFRFESVEGAGHFLHLEEPKRVGELILEWLSH